MRLEHQLRHLIPGSLRTFAKLEDGDPYRFERWGRDRAGTECLYYAFPSRDGRRQHVKRVPVQEVRAALGLLVRTGVLNREGFVGACPISESAGPCGFAVVGRMLQHLGVAAYLGRGQGFGLTNPPRARALLTSR